MKFKKVLALSVIGACQVLTLSSIHAADKVKVGFVSTLSGPSAALGVDIRDAFQLAV